MNTQRCRILYILIVLLALLYPYKRELEAAEVRIEPKGESVQIPLARLEKIRTSLETDKTRLVLDLNTTPDYTVTFQENPPRLIVDLENSEMAPNLLPVMSVPDSLVTNIITVPGQGQRVKIVIDLAYFPQYSVYKLASPPRMVIDIWKVFEQRSERLLADGLHYVSLRKSTGEDLLAIHILDFDLSSNALKLGHVLAKDGVNGLETVSSMALRSNAIAAVNGTYFTKPGELLGLVLYGDQIIQSPVANRSVFVLKKSGEVMIEQVGYHGELEAPNGVKCNINAINRQRAADELVIYTPAYGLSTRTNTYGKEYTVVDGKIVQINYGDSIIPTNGYVVSAHGFSMKQIFDLKVGDQISIKHQLDPDLTGVHLAIGAGPQLVKDGNIYLTTKSEGFGGDVGGGKAPRTALGITPDQHLLIVTVDGRQPGHSAGVTLIELAKLMQDLGVKDAMNLDGGGSTAMVIGGQLINRPSDGKERDVGDALVIVPIEQKTEVIAIFSSEQDHKSRLSNAKKRAI